MNKLFNTLRFTLKKDDFENNVVVEKNKVISDLNRAKHELDSAISNFSFVTEPELIELYSYQIKAAQLKYNYHLTRAKKISS